MNEHINHLCLIGIGVLISILSITTTLAMEGERDSTAVREPERPKMTTAEKILKVPGEIAKLPVYILKGATLGIVYGVTETRLRGLFDIDNPAKPFYPVAGYGSNQGIKGGVGLRLKNILVAGDKLKLKSSYSTHRYQRYWLKYRGREVVGGHSELIFNIEYGKRPEESFYGFGNESDVDNETNFTLERTRILAEPSWSLRSNISVGMILGFSAVNIFDGRDRSSEHRIADILKIHNLSLDYFRSTRFFSAGGEIGCDWTDHKGQPSRGARGRIKATFNKGTGRSEELDFFITRFDLSGYLNLFKKRILALRIIGQSVDQSGRAQIVPVYLLSTLGGIDDLRGFRSFRFVGRDMAMLTLEYRYPLWDVIDAFIFLDQGHVFDDLVEDFTFRSWHADYGIGIRVWNNDGVVLLTQTAFSSETTRFYLELGAEW